LDLIASPEALYLTQFKLSAIQNPKGFAGFLKKHLSNKKIMKVWQKGLDRVVVLEFEKYYLVCEFFDYGNAILCGKDWNILQPFHRQEWKDRKLAKGEIYKFPQNLTPEKMKALSERLAKEKKPEGLMEKIDEELSERLLENKEETKKETNTEKKKAKLLYSIKEQEKAKEKFLKEVEENQKKAELLYANTQEVQELLNAIKAGKEKELSESEIERKLLQAKAQGTYGARLIKEIKLKEKKLILEIE
jgi:predicted ribosome quality control (RQC) complex YloA/Tae2 family protein